MTTHRSFSARADIEALLAARDAQRLDVAVLQPADPFLDTAGEELRRRIFITHSETGTALCLRPEFTIPVCRAHIANGLEAARHAYVGTVFRQRREGANEFLQAGIEDLGHSDPAGADARAMADAATLLDALGAGRFDTLLGDQTVFDAVLEALDLPRGWRLRLAHAFGDAQALQRAQAALTEPVYMPPMPDDVAAAVAAGDAQAVATAVETHLERAGLVHGEGRSGAEIAARLLARAAQARTRITPRTAQALRTFLDIRCPLADAAGALEAFASGHGLDIAPALDLFRARTARIIEAMPQADAITYDAAFGRALDYYTGLVFEMRGPDGLVLCGGGRYDRLLKMLGAQTPVTGVGFSLWLDRIEKKEAGS